MVGCRGWGQGIGRKRRGWSWGSCGMIGVCVMLVIRMVVVMTHCICKGSIASTGCRSTVVLLPPLLMRIHDGEQGSSAKRALNTRNSRTVLNHNGWGVRMKVNFENWAALRNSTDTRKSTKFMEIKESHGTSWKIKTGNVLQ